MMPPWTITLLLGNYYAEEFFYNKECTIDIRGKFIDGEWVIDARVDALPNFISGCHNFHTGFNRSFKELTENFIASVKK